MRIEVGKAYRTRDGRKVIVERKTSMPVYPFWVESDREQWATDADGRYTGAFLDQPEDLVAPWTGASFDPIAALRQRAVEHAAELPAPSPRPAVGQVWVTDYEAYYILCEAGYGVGQYTAIAINDGIPWCEPCSISEVIDGLGYVAPSLREYLANGGTL